MRVVVVGGGFAGLITASEVIANGIEDVTVVEKEMESGGVARTISRDGFELEPAVGSFNLPHPHLSKIFERIDVEALPARPVASTRYIFTGGELVELPLPPQLLLAPIISVRAKLRALWDIFSPPDYETGDESLASFMTRRFGAEAGRLMAWLMASGVFAGDPDSLSVQAAFPMMPTHEKLEGSVIKGAIRRRRGISSVGARPRPHYPRGGMAAFADALADSLGERFRPGFEVGRVRRSGSEWQIEGSDSLLADVLVLACSPQVVSAILDLDGSEVFSRAATAPVVVVGFGGEGSPIPDGFGALVGPDENLSTLGVLFESSYAPDRAPANSWLVKVIAGGATRPEIVEWVDDRLVSALLTELSEMFGTELEPSFVEVVRHRVGIPQYNVGHTAWLDSIEETTSDLEGLYLTGWGYRGVGLGHIAAEASGVASRIARAGIERAD